MTRILSLILLLIPALLPGQQPTFHPVTWDFTEPLVPQAIAEDASGFIWMATRGEVVRYDGASFVVYAHPDSMAGQVQSLLPEGAEAMICGTDSGELWMLDGNSPWLIGKLPEAIRIQSMAFLNDSMLAIGTYGAGLWLWHIGSGPVRQFRQGDGSGFPDDFVYQVLVDAIGYLWASTDAGVVRMDSGAGGDTAMRVYTKADGLPDQIIPAMTCGPDGLRIWVGGYEGGISVFDPAKDQFTPFRITANLSQIRHLVAGQHAIWIGTRKEGVWELEPETDDLSSIPAAGEGEIQAMHLDAERNLWVSSRQMGLQIALTVIRTIPVSKFLSSDNIRCLAAALDGTLWYSTEEGLYRLNPDEEKLQEPVFSPSRYFLPPIISLYAAPDGVLWLGTFGGGLVRFQPETGAVKIFTEQDGLTNGNILSVTGMNDQIWVGTLGGVSRISLGEDGQPEIRQFTREDGISDNYIYQIHAGPGGHLWIATDGQGMTRMTGDQLYIFQEAQGLTDRVIYSVTTDAEGVAWALGQEGHVFRIEGNMAREVPTAFRVGRAQASGIVSTADQALLIMHEDGIDRYDPETGLLISYGKHIGVENISPDLNAFCTDSQGKVWIGTREGLLIYTPLDTTARVFPHLVFDEAALFFNPSTSLFDQPLAADQNHLTFHYVALWYQDPEAVRYRHQLQGYDLDWVRSDNLQVSYPRLSDGTYTFRAAAGLSSQFPSSFEVTFTILPPFYRTWWFWLLVILGLSLVLVIVVRTREQRLTLQSNREKENIRYQFDLLRNQVNPHFLFNSFNTLIALIEHDQTGAVHYVEKLSDLFRNMLEYRRETVISLKEELALLENYVYLQKQRYRENLGIRFEVDERTLRTMIPPLTLQMLVENAIKHNVISSKKPLQITVRSTGNRILISNPLQLRRQAPPSTGLGLENIRKRFQLLTSEPVETQQTESEFIVSIPLLSS